MSKTFADKARVHLGPYCTAANAAAAGLSLEQLQSFLEGTCELTEAQIRALTRVYIETANLRQSHHPRRSNHV